MSVIKINANNLNEIRNNEKTILLDFYADWCGPCRMISPIINEIAEENPQYIVGKINVDEEPALSLEYGISSIPALIVIKNGRIVNRSVGAKTKSQILAMLY
ncbi:MAG: thioredoxin [Oscillospiraceae bacterium]|nr:thioredoxin [Oscillospiraceae bacterium]